MQRHAVRGTQLAQRPKQAMWHSLTDSPQLSGWRASPAVLDAVLSVLLEIGDAAGVGGGGDAYGAAALQAVINAAGDAHRRARQQPARREQGRQQQQQRQQQRTSVDAGWPYQASVQAVVCCMCCINMRSS